MGRIRLTGATSGYTELRAASTAGNNTITLPTTNGGEVVVSDSSGNVNIDSGTFYVDATNNRVGVGSNAPSYLLDLLGSAPRIRVKDSSTGAAFHHFENNSGNFYLGIDNSTGGSLSAGNYARVLWSQGAYPLVFATNDTQRAQIDSSGRLLVGTSSARTTANITSQIQVEGTGFSNSSLSLTANSNDSDSAYFIFTKTRGTSVGSNTLVQNGDQLGYIGFGGADGVDTMQNGAGIAAYVDGTPGTNDMPGRLVFSTTADGASSPTERMRITQAGHFGFFGTDPATEVRSLSSGSGLRLLNNSYQESAFGNSGYWIFNNTASSGTRTMMFFRVQGVDRGSITSDGSTTAFNTSSDYRLKEDWHPVANAVDRLQLLNPVNFAWKETGKRVDGFIAHEVQAVVPEAITGEKDAVDDEGNPIYQGIDQSKLVPLLTAALQEAVAKIESLEARLTAAGI